MTRSGMISLCVFWAFLLSATGFAQQTVQIVNDNAPAKADSDVWVLFVGNPANVTASGATISGMRNLSIPTTAVTTAQSQGATVVQSNTFQSSAYVLPAVPFPLQFISGANAGSQVQVTAYASATGTFTVQKDPTLSTPNWPLQAQAQGDQFVLGAYSQKLSTLPTAAGTISSPLSGASRNVYSLTAQALDAAVVYVSYGQLTYLATAPSITSSTIPFQTVELTTGAGGGATTSDLTVIDYFAIPLQIESINQSDGSVADTRTFYFKSSTIAAGLKKIGATFSNNARYLGPGQVTAIPSNNGSPSPFPSFKGYLQSLETKTFQLDGTSNYGTPNPAVVYGITAGGTGTSPAGGYDSTYGYVATLTEDSGNFSVVMKPQPGRNSFTNAPPYFPSVSNIDNVTINLPLATTTDPVGYDAIIYGAVLDASSFQINLKAGSPSLTPLTLSGPFSVTSGASTTQFTASVLGQLATSKLGGLTVKFLPETTNAGQTASISSVDSTGKVTLATALTAVPAVNDSFQILFPVTSSTGNTSTFFGSTYLNTLNFLAPFSVMFEGTANAGKTADAIAIDSAGNVTLRWPKDVTSPQPPAQGELFAVTVASDDIFTQLYTNSTFSWVVSQVLSGLNFGFPGSSTAGDSSAGWYASFPQQYPFGLARGTTDDGFYNPWAAYFYNASDAYGFAFSDRIAPSPLMSTNPATQSFRITVLPSTQIDAPLVKTTAVTNSQISLSWPAETSVTYTVTTLPVIPAGQISVNSTAGTATLTSLPAGTPYQIFVKGTKGAQTSLVLPAYANTTGPLTPTTGAAPFGAAFTWGAGGNLPSTYSVLLNGKTFLLSGNPAHSTANVALGGNAGNNLYVLDFQDTSQSNKSVYKGVMEVNVTDLITPPANPASFKLGGTPTLYGSSGALTVAPSTGPYVITYPGGGTVGVSPLVLNFSFMPQVRKEYAPVVTPPPP